VLAYVTTANLNCKTQRLMSVCTGVFPTACAPGTWSGPAAIRCTSTASVCLGIGQEQKAHTCASLQTAPRAPGAPPPMPVRSPPATVRAPHATNNKRSVAHRKAVAQTVWPGLRAWLRALRPSLSAAVRLGTLRWARCVAFRLTEPGWMYG
jgi:hypothetical protein